MVGLSHRNTSTKCRTGHWGWKTKAYWKIEIFFIFFKNREYRHFCWSYHYLLPKVDGRGSEIDIFIFNAKKNLSSVNTNLSPEIWDNLVENWQLFSQTNPRNVNGNANYILWIIAITIIQKHIIGQPVCLCRTVE